MMPNSNVSDRERSRSLRRTSKGRGYACALSILLVAPLLPEIASAIVQTDGGPVASRVISTATLSPAEARASALQGRFRGFLGTPISEHYFLTAQHIGISPTDTIDFTQGPNAGSYSIVTWHDDPLSDLRIVEIDGTFDDWALLNAASNEPGQRVIIFGRGGAPSGTVSVEGELKGWTAAGPDGQVSWGQNEVTGTFGLNQVYARFDRFGLQNEGGLTVGDSGGAWFYVDAIGVSRLLAISFAVTGPFQRDAGGAPDGVPFEAALYDIGGLWVGSPGGETFVPNNPVDIPGVLFGTRVSQSIGWIESIVPISVEDSDSDGVPDSQDNCPFVSNADQADSGGLGFGNTPDGIGNACQCGDVTGEGQANDTDAVFIKRQALGLAAPLFLVPDNCDVNGDGRCSGIDATLLRHAASGAPPETFGQSCPNALP